MCGQWHEDGGVGQRQPLVSLEPTTQANLPASRLQTIMINGGPHHRNDLADVERVGQPFAEARGWLGRANDPLES